MIQAPVKSKEDETSETPGSYCLPPIETLAASPQPPAPRSTPRPFWARFRSPAALPPLLLLLTAAPLLLLPVAVWQSVQSGAAARDINHSGSLRYRAMWLYGATALSFDESNHEDWVAQWREMNAIRTDLAQRYPREVAQTDASWNAVTESLNQRGRVKWGDANHLRQDADTLTNAIDETLQKSTANARLLYGAGILSLALLLPWSWRLTRLLQQTKTVLHTRETDLADASVRYDRLFEVMPSACFAYDADGRITTWNGASEELFGKPAGEVSGKPLWEVISQPENKERNQNIVRDVVSGIPHTDLEWAYQTPNGEQKQVVSTVFPLHGAGGIIGGVSANMDVTERKRASDALQALTSELQRSNRELAAFASVASHDLKEPLRKIETFGGLLQRKAGPTLSPESADYLKRMISAAGRMNGLIDGLLEYGRVTTKPRSLQSVDLNRVAREVVDDLEARIAQTGATVSLDDLPHVWGDALQMRQLLQNLIGNALKFHAPGSVPHVQVGSVACGDFGGVVPPPLSAEGCACVFVRDNGIGFEAEHAERIFDVFERLDGANRAYEGSGVGLAICRKIAQQHGGVISAQSQPGCGATFTVVLPVVLPFSPQKQFAAVLPIATQSAH